MELTFLSIIIKLTIVGSAMALVTLLLRFILKPLLPKTFIIGLWIAVFLAFLIPLTPPTPTFLSNQATAADNNHYQTWLQLPDASTIVQTFARPRVKQAQSDIKSYESKSFDPYLAAFLLYCSVAVTLIIIFSVLYCLTLRRFKRTVPISENERYRMLREKVRIRSQVNLVVSSNTNVPVTVGVFQPCIILPEDFDFKNRRIIDHIYVHELVHIRRHDSALCLAALFICCLHWYNPLIWIAHYLLSRDLELACDSQVVKILGYQERTNYAESLLAMAGKKKIKQSMFVNAFGKNNMRERIVNIMNTKRITVKVLSLCVISVIIMGGAFLFVSCAQHRDVSSANGVVADAKDITTDANKTYFLDHYVRPYYLNIRIDYNGKITSKELGDQILHCAVNNNDYVDIEKYAGDDGYILPQAVGDQIIQNRFDLRSVDHSKISCYDEQKKAYVISSDMFGQGAYVCEEIENIKQTGDIVTVTASFYDPDENNKNADGTEKPNYNNKLSTFRFTLKSVNDHYLYKKVEIEN